VSFNPKLDEFLSRLKNVSKTPNGWEACCPAHDDTRPSLSIAVSDDGKILLTCFSNHCHPVQIVGSVGMMTKDLFPPKDDRGRAEWGSLVKTYTYCDENNVPLFEVCRFEKMERNADGTERKVKTFRQRHRANGEWVWKMKGVRRVLYRLPQLLAAKDEPVWIVEGEKQVDYLASLGLCATCNPQGAGKWQDEFAECLRGRDVIIIPDNDPITEKNGKVSCVGLEHAESVADSLSGKAKSIHVVQLPGSEEKWGLDDWLQKGAHELEELEDLLADALPWIYGAKLFDRTPENKPKADDDPYAFHREVMATVQLEVLGELETGHVLLYSRFCRKTVVLSPADVSKLPLPRLLQIAGPPAAAGVYAGKDTTPDGQVTMHDVRNAISLLASRRQVEETLRGCGVWDCGDCLVLVSRGELVAVNGHLERVESAEIRNHVFDLNDVARPWFDFNELSVAWAASADQKWCQSVVRRAEKLFSQWTYKSKDSDTLLVGLIMATWIQSVWSWRPQVFILGESNTGKTSMFHALAGAEHSGEKGVFGSLALKFANYTAAGLSQSIGRSSKVVICDELEQSKAREEILTMVRASGRGDPGVRGTTGHRSKSFRLHQIFWMGSTESGLNKEVDQNRYIRIQLTRTTDAAKWASFRMPPDKELQKLGLELLVCALRHKTRAVALADYLYRSKPPGINDRICESYAVPTATLAAAIGKTDDEAFALYVDLLKIVEVGEVEKAQAQVIEDILNSLVDCGHGVRKPVSEIVTNIIKEGEYTTLTTESSLNSHGVSVCRQNGNDRSSPIGLFLAPKIILRCLLKDTEWKKTRIGEHLIRLTGAERCKKYINGSMPWGYWVPITSIETLNDAAADRAS